MGARSPCIQEHNILGRDKLLMLKFYIQKIKLILSTRREIRIGYLIRFSGLLHIYVLYTQIEISQSQPNKHMSCRRY